jgi:serine/threonine-protein kinase
MPADPTVALSPTAAMDPTYASPSGELPTSMLPSGKEDSKNRAGLWVLLALLGVALIAVAVLVLPQVLGPKTPTIPQTTVPQLVEKTEAQAATLLQSKNLKGSPTRQSSDNVPEGVVISHNPPVGTSLREGQTVEYVVSTGKGEVVVPDLTGLTQSKAEQSLKDEGLVLGQVNTVDSMDQTKGKVVSSSPGQGESVTKGTAVDIEIASGKDNVPNVIGETVANASNNLTDAGLKVDATQFEESTQPEGTIIKQSVSNKTVDQGTTIVLVVAKPPATATTPPPTDGGGDTPSPTST